MQSDPPHLSCSPGPRVPFCLPLRADDWPQWLGPRRDSVWRETGIVEKFPASGPPIRWRTPVSAVIPARRRARTRLSHRPPALHRRQQSGRPFARGVIPGSERVLCLDADTGKILWHHDTTAPTP